VAGREEAKEDPREGGNRKEKTMRTLSDGSPSTLGTYRDYAEALGIDKAVAFFDQRIAKSPEGRDEEILKDVTQMLYLIMSMAE